MIALQVKDLAKSFGVNSIFKDISFVLAKGEKAALIGPNGAGKTTLLKCLTGEESTDQGTISFSEHCSVGYLQQIPVYPPGMTLLSIMIEVFSDIFALRDKLTALEEEMSNCSDADLLQVIMDRYAAFSERYERSGGFAVEATIRKILFGLGFKPEDLERDINSFSGGEKTRASLAKLLVRKPDFLLLDEPTNHLDLNALEWLESYLSSFQGTVLLIAHDRYFLDHTTEKTLELVNGSLYSYPGSYSSYLKLKAERNLAAERAFAKQQKVIKETEEYIRRYKAGIKAKQARGRQSQLERLERVAQVEQQRHLTLSTRHQEVAASGNMVLTLENVSFAFADNKALLQQADLLIEKNEKVVIVGANGVGKSTLLKLVLQELIPQQGTVRTGSRVEIGYFDQQHADLNPQLSVLEELTHNFDINDGEARNYLAAFLFIGDDVFKQVADLSGGERGRLTFLKLYLSAPNFMLLDEPTNHLDIISKEIIEEYLQQYQGTILAVSHDRYFLNKIATRIVEMGDGKLSNYQGNYTYYKEKKFRERENELAIRQRVKEQQKLQDKQQRQRASASKPQINKAKTRAQIELLEQEISNGEKRLAVLSELLSAGESYQNERLIKELVAEYNELESSIPQLYAEWENLSDLLANS